MIERRLRKLDWLDEEQRKCWPYKGPTTATAFFERLIGDPGSGDYPFLAPTMKWDIRALCGRFRAGRWEPVLRTLLDEYLQRQ